eukprot:COSAG02_NODE_147_length_33939_cov_6.689539_19_plen_68_part_00
MAPVAEAVQHSTAQHSTKRGVALVLPFVYTRGCPVQYKAWRAAAGQRLLSTLRSLAPSPVCAYTVLG